MPIAEFLESDLIHHFLFARPPEEIPETGACLCEFFVSVAELLERIEPRAFPENSLHFAKSFRRAIEWMKGEVRTPDQHVSS